MQPNIAQQCYNALLHTTEYCLVKLLPGAKRRSNAAADVTMTVSAGRSQSAYRVGMSWNAVNRRHALYHKCLRVTAACCLHLEALVYMSEWSISFRYSVVWLSAQALNSS